MEIKEEDVHLHYPFVEEAEGPPYTFTIKEEDCEDNEVLFEHLIPLNL